LVSHTNSVAEHVLLAFRQGDFDFTNVMALASVEIGSCAVGVVIAIYGVTAVVARLDSAIFTASISQSIGCDYIAL